MSGLNWTEEDLQAYRARQATGKTGKAAVGPRQNDENPEARR